MADSPKTALVLAGGGLVGGAWMIGALHAIATETGWDPGAADYVQGTSAGSMIGALLTSAVPPWLLMAYGAGEQVDGWPELEGGAVRFAGRLQVHWSFPRPVLGSPALAIRSLREPWKYGPAGIAAWLPRGVISTEPLKEIIRQVVPKGWSPHPNFWVVAIDYATGARVVFGRLRAPRADLADAVAASCAIPGFYHPVTIHRRRYIDGGMLSPANLDLLLESDADLVVCLNPMSSAHRSGFLGPTGPIAALVRGDNRRVMDRECLAMQRAGKRVLLIEPQAADLRAMGYNYMSRSHLDRVTETAVRTTAALLSSTDIGRQLKALPSGPPERVRRPAGAPSNWPRRLFPPVPRSA